MPRYYVKLDNNVWVRDDKNLKSLLKWWKSLSVHKSEPDIIRVLGFDEGISYILNC